MITDLPSHPGKFVTPADLADYCDLALRTIYNHIASGYLPAVRMGNKVLKIPIDAARAYASVPAAQPATHPVQRVHSRH